MAECPRSTIWPPRSTIGLSLWHGRHWWEVPRIPCLTTPLSSSGLTWTVRRRSETFPVDTPGRVPIAATSAASAVFTLCTATVHRPRTRREEHRRSPPTPVTTHVHPERRAHHGRRSCRSSVNTRGSSINTPTTTTCISNGGPSLPLVSGRHHSLLCDGHLIRLLRDHHGLLMSCEEIGVGRRWKHELARGDHLRSLHLLPCSHVVPSLTAVLRGIEAHLHRIAHHGVHGAHPCKGLIDGSVVVIVVFIFNDGPPPIDDVAQL